MARSILFFRKYAVSENTDIITISGGFPGGSVVKNLPETGATRDAISLPGSGRSPRGGNGNPLQYSCLENPMDRVSQRTTIHGVTKNWT